MTRTRGSVIRWVPLDVALILLAAAAVGLGVIETILAARAVPQHRILVGSLPAGGAAFVLVGALAWSRRPHNRTGALLCITGLLTLACSVSGVGLPDAVDSFAVLLAEAPIAAALHVVLAFPSGRLPTRWDWRIVAALYVAVLVRQAPVALPGPDLEGLRLACSLVGSALLVVAAVRLVLRVRAAPRGTSERRVLVAVYGYGMGFLLFLPFSARVLTPLLGLDQATLAAVQSAAFFILPFVFAAAVLRGGFVRTGELESLLSWLVVEGRDERPLRDVLAQVLGDPSLEVVFARPGSGRLVDVAGRPAEVNLGPGRAAIAVPGADSAETGVTLVYDTTLDADAVRVEQAGRVVAVALERERLRADLLAEQNALRASRARVVEIGDAERRRLAHDLHDLLQSGLTLVALHAGRLASSTTDDQARAGLTQIGSELDDLITEFRNVVHGVMPALLLERGLPAAVEELLDRLPLQVRLDLDGAEQLPPAVATGAYFIVAEALTNAVKHARANALEVEIAEDAGMLRLLVRDDGIGGARPTGAGLRGIADRVDALSGRVDVVSCPGVGTSIEVVLPCAS